MNLRNILIGAATATALVSIAGVASAANTATASATIVAPQAIQTSQTLAFGTIAKPSQGSTVVKVAATTAASATPSLTGGNGYITQSGQAHAAVFHLTGGTTGHSVTVTSPTLEWGADETGDASAFASTVVLPTTLPSFDASGVADLPVGGQITISDQTVVKTYNGTLSVTIAFN